MIPLRDTLTLRHEPWVTRSLVVANAVMFFIQLLSGPAGEIYVRVFGFVPARLFNPAVFQYALWESLITLVTSLFLHGGPVHLIGNMLYLWIFGDDVEDAIGHGRFFVFYILCGAFGSLAHAMLFAGSRIPSIGASGSIAGVLGAFLVLHPKARIVTLFPLVVSWAIAEIPAILFLPVWFAMQFASGWFSLASARATQEVAGIAWWAHVGGFLFGAGALIVAKLVRSGPKTQAGAL